MTTQAWAWTIPLDQELVDGPDGEDILEAAKDILRARAFAIGVTLDAEPFTLLEPPKINGEALTFTYEDPDTGETTEAPPTYMLRISGMRNR